MSVWIIGWSEKVSVQRTQEGPVIKYTSSHLRTYVWTHAGNVRHKTFLISEFMAYNLKRWWKKGKFGGLRERERERDCSCWHGWDIKHTREIDNRTRQIISIKILWQNHIKCEKQTRAFFFFLPHIHSVCSMCVCVCVSTLQHQRSYGY